MFVAPFIIRSLLKNFTSKGPISLELYPDEDPINTSTIVYKKYLNEIYIDVDNADQATKVTRNKNHEIKTLFYFV